MAKLSPITQDLILRSKAYQQGMDDANKKLRKFRGASRGAAGAASQFGSKIKMLGGAALGLAGIGGLGSLIQSSIQFGSAQSDIAGQLKINTTAFQVYSGAIRDAGGTQEQMRKSILSQNQAIVQGAEGLTTYSRAFDRLGINVKSLRGLAPEEAFMRIAAAVANAKDQQAALTSVSEIYGKRNAPELIEVMERLTRDGFGKMSEEIRKTYGIMDEETQKRLDRAADRIEQFKQKATIKVGELIAGEAGGAALKALGFEVLGVVGKFGGGIVDALLTARDFMRAAFVGTLEYVAFKFGSALEGVVDKIRLGLGNAMIAIAEKNPLVNTKEFQEMLDAQQAMQADIARRQKQREVEGLKNWGNFFTNNLSEQTNFANDFGGFWSEKAAEQNALLVESRKADDARAATTRDLIESLNIDSKRGSAMSTAAAPDTKEGGRGAGFLVGRNEGESRIDFIRRREQSRRDYILGRTSASGVMGSETGISPKPAEASRSMSMESTIMVLRQMLGELQVIRAEFTTSTA